MSRNTTTCINCGRDFPDSEMVPLLCNGGECCNRCVELITEHSLALFDVLHDIVNRAEIVATREGPGDAIEHRGIADLGHAKALLCQITDASHGLSLK